MSTVQSLSMLRMPVAGSVWSEVTSVRSKTGKRSCVGYLMKYASTTSSHGKSYSYVCTGAFMEGGLVDAPEKESQRQAGLGRERRGGRSHSVAFFAFFCAIPFSFLSFPFLSSVSNVQFPSVNGAKNPHVIVFLVCGGSCDSVSCRSLVCDSHTVWQARHSGKRTAPGPHCQ